MKEKNPYFSLFYGERVSGSDLRTQATFAGKEFDTLFKIGKIIGQRTLEEDVVWWMPDKVKRE